MLILEVMTYESHEEKRAEPLQEREVGTKPCGSSRTRSYMEAANPLLVAGTEI